MILPSKSDKLYLFGLFVVYGDDVTGFDGDPHCGFLDGDVIY
jgi:hypothetical protein